MYKKAEETGLRDLDLKYFQSNLKYFFNKNIVDPDNYDELKFEFENNFDPIEEKRVSIFIMRKIGDIRVPIKVDGKYKLKTDSPLITKFEEQLQEEERLYEEEERRRKEMVTIIPSILKKYNNENLERLLFKEITSYKYERRLNKNNGLKDVRLKFIDILSKKLNLVQVTLIFNNNTTFIFYFNIYNLSLDKQTLKKYGIKLGGSF